MKNLSPEQKLIAELHGQAHAMRVCINALIASMPSVQRPEFANNLLLLEEQQNAVLLALAVPEEQIQAFAAELLSIKQLSAQQTN